MLSIVAFTTFACGHGEPPPAAEAPDPPEVVLGERLFLETRFAQYFAAHSNGVINAPLSEGDPIMDATLTLAEPLPGPFAGQSMNCRACHLVDEQGEEPSGGVRTYADFARRSPIPEREDGEVTTPRNSPPLVNASLSRAVPVFFHFDGEFPTLVDLIKGTFTGRNFGWLADEAAVATAHIAGVVRGDDGRGALARENGGLPYRVVLAGVDPAIPSALLIPPEFRFDVDQATDGEVLDGISRLVAAYVESLVFARDATGEFDGSPYDRFLRKNGLPRTPAAGESALDYSRRLRSLVAALQSPQFVSLRDGSFELHTQEFRFNATELEGLRIFLREPAGEGAGAAHGVGNCIACHAAPTFTDFRFHNTGATEEEYDQLHGSGAFASLTIPDLATRNAAPAAYLPPSAAYPTARGPFRQVPAVARPGETDLGVWNILGNPAIPGPQEALQASLCQQFGLTASACAADALLPFTIAVFKTPGLRDLGQSAPYLHTGQKDTVEDVLRFYISASTKARAGSLRNAAPELSGMRLDAEDVVPLAAFLRALNEDYQ